MAHSPVQARFQPTPVQAPVQSPIQAPVAPVQSPVEAPVAPVQLPIQAPVQAPVQPVQAPIQAPVQQPIQAAGTQVYMAVDSAPLPFLRFRAFPTPRRAHIQQADMQDAHVWLNVVKVILEETAAHFGGR